MTILLLVRFNKMHGNWLLSIQCQIWWNEDVLNNPLIAGAIWNRNFDQWSFLRCLYVSFLTRLEIASRLRSDNILMFYMSFTLLLRLKLHHVLSNICLISCFLEKKFVSFESFGPNECHDYHFYLLNLFLFLWPVNNQQARVCFVASAQPLELGKWK